MSTVAQTWFSVKAERFIVLAKGEGFYTRIDAIDRTLSGFRTSQLLNLIHSYHSYHWCPVVDGGKGWRHTVQSRRATISKQTIRYTLGGKHYLPHTQDHSWPEPTRFTRSQDVQPRTSAEIIGIRTDNLLTIRQKLFLKFLCSRFRTMSTYYVLQPKHHGLHLSGWRFISVLSCARVWWTQPSKNALPPHTIS